MYEGRRGSPRKVAWFKISEPRERDILVAVGNEEFSFGGKAVGGKHVNEVLAGGRRNAGGTHQISLEERQRGRNRNCVNAGEVEVQGVRGRTVVVDESGETIIVRGV